MKHLQKYFFVLLGILLTVGALIPANEQKVQAASPYTINLSVSPDPIGSQNEVSLYTTIDASANSLPDPSQVCYTVPRALVRDSSNFANQTLPSYLTYAGSTATADTFTFCYNLDRSANVGNFLHVEFAIVFTSSVIYEGQVEPSYPFTVTLGDQTSTQTIATKPGVPTYPTFSKYRKFSVNASGQGLLDPTYPNYNSYELVYNRNFINSFTNVNISDTLATGTTLYEDYTGINIPGDRATNVHGIRVYQIDSTIVAPAESRSYVTNQFLDKITYDKDTGQFNVDLGNPPVGLSYVVLYAVEVTDPGLGIYTNTAKLASDQLNTTRSLNDVIKFGGDSSGFFNKSVAETLIPMSQETLTYSLNVGGSGYTIPNGTIFYDIFPPGVNFDKITNDANGIFRVKSVEGTKVTFETTQEITSRTLLAFQVRFDGDFSDEEIDNTAYITLGANSYYSNTVTTERVADPTTDNNSTDNNSSSNNTSGNNIPQPALPITGQGMTEVLILGLELVTVGLLLKRRK